MYVWVLVCACECRYLCRPEEGARSPNSQSSCELSFGDWKLPSCFKAAGPHYGLIPQPALIDHCGLTYAEGEEATGVSY